MNNKNNGCKDGSGILKTYREVKNRIFFLDELTREKDDVLIRFKSVGPQDTIHACVRQNDMRGKSEEDIVEFNTKSNYPFLKILSEFGKVTVRIGDEITSLGEDILKEIQAEEKKMSKKIINEDNIDLHSLILDFEERKYSLYIYRIYGESVSISFISEDKENTYIVTANKLDKNTVIHSSNVYTLQELISIFGKVTLSGSFLINHSSAWEIEYDGKEGKLRKVYK